MTHHIFIIIIMGAPPLKKWVISRRIRNSQHITQFDTLADKECPIKATQNHRKTRPLSPSWPWRQWWRPIIIIVIVWLHLIYIFANWCRTIADFPLGMLRKKRKNVEFNARLTVNAAAAPWLDGWMDDKWSDHWLRLLLWTEFLLIMAAIGVFIWIYSTSGGIVTMILDGDARSRWLMDLVFIFDADRGMAELTGWSDGGCRHITILGKKRWNFLLFLLKWRSCDFWLNPGS